MALRRDHRRPQTRTLRLYVDASALVKLLIVEPETVEVAGWWDEADEVLSAGVAYVESRAAIARRLSGQVAVDARRELEKLWDALEVVAVDDQLIESAARVADVHRLRALGALHLAAAQRLVVHGLVFCCWDRELRRAARNTGFATAP